MKFRFALLAFLLCAGFPSYAEPLPARSAELYSWRTPEGEVLFGLRVDNIPTTAEMLIEDKKYQIRTQAELGQTLQKLGPGQPVSWSHMNVKGKASLPPEEVEVETKETAINAKVVLTISQATTLEPEYWNQPRGRYEDALKKLAAAGSDDAKLQPLRTAAREAFALGLYPEAKKHATELELLAPKLKENWNYGDAVQDCNIILGRVAVIEGDLDTARGHLLGAGYSPGSPVMNTLGPDMSLARDLLAKGERSAIVDYLELCRNFWKTDHGLIDQWSLQIKNGKTPDFGTNLRD